MNFYDTNVLLSDIEYVKQNGFFMISSITLQELEGIKTSATKSEEVKFQARRAAKFLKDNIGNYKISDINTKDPKMFYLPETNDSKIIMDFYAEEGRNNELKFVTNDLMCWHFARTLSENVLLLKDTIEEKIYGGYEEVELNNDSFLELYDSYQNGENPLGLIENQYLIVHCEGKTTEYVYRNRTLHGLKLPKGIKALNSKQRCALDLLENEDVPIKVLCGVYGTGKTFLSVNVAVNKVTKSSKSNIAKIFLVRQPYGEGDEIGYLKGTKEEKIKDFFNPITDNIDGGMFTLNTLLEKGQLDTDVPFYMKGRSLPATMLLVDEAEDLTLKQIKLLGSRIADNSNIVFIGDWNQASGKYEYNCGLVQFIKYVYEHPNPLVGVMVMDEDVRSDASKYFADIV